MTVNRPRSIRLFAWAFGAIAFVLVLSAPAAASCSSPRAINGTPGDDVLTGTARGERMSGRGGDDVIRGLGGGDLLCGGPGHDQIYGDEGSDFLIGGLDNDVLDGGTGRDHFRPLLGDDVLSGGDGFDSAVFSGADSALSIDLVAGTVSGQGEDTISGVEEVWGSNWGDTIVGDANNNIIWTGEGPDVVDAGDGNDRIYEQVGFWENQLAGGPGNDLIESGAWGDDMLDGGTGDDRLMSSEGDDRLLGGDGNDRLADIEGDNNAIDGGSGTDLLYFPYGGFRLIVDLAAGGFDSGRATGTLLGVESVRGTRGNDRLLGDDADNVLRGAGGDDHLDGRGGNDQLDGGRGTDSCLSGERVVGCE